LKITKNDINRELWEDSDFINVFEITPTENLTGNLNLEFTFNKATSSSITVLLLAEKKIVARLDKYGFVDIN